MVNGEHGVLGPLIQRLRAICAAEAAPAPRWAAIGEALRDALADPALRRDAASWPERDRPGPVNLLFHEDAAHGFVLNGLVKTPREGTPVHDHAHTWTAYGVVQGEERMVRYRRLDDSAEAGQVRLELLDDGIVREGDVDVVPPGLIHAEFAGAGRTVALIIRSARLGDFPQGMFDPESGRAWTAPGPTQLPWPAAPG